MDEVKFEFTRFNERRKMRGAEAVEFKITDSEGTGYLWMSRRDIENNIETFPECRDQLEVGLGYYVNPFTR